MLHGFRTKKFFGLLHESIRITSFKFLVEETDQNIVSKHFLCHTKTLLVAKTVVSKNNLQSAQVL